MKHQTPLNERSAYWSPFQIWHNKREKLSTAQLRQERQTVTKHTTNASVVARIDVTAAHFTVYYLMEKCGKLYPPFLMPSGTIAEVHQVLHLLHCFDGGHLETTKNYIWIYIYISFHPARIKSRYSGSTWSCFLVYLSGGGGKRLFALGFLFVVYLKLLPHPSCCVWTLQHPSCV